MCTRTQCVSKSLERTRPNVGPQVGVVLDVRATRQPRTSVSILVTPPFEEGGVTYWPTQAAHRLVEAWQLDRC